MASLQSITGKKISQLLFWGIPPKNLFSGKSVCQSEKGIDLKKQ